MRPPAPDYKQTKLYRDVQEHWKGMTHEEILEQGLAGINAMRAELGQKPLPRVPKFDGDGHIINYPPEKPLRIPFTERLKHAWWILTHSER